MSSNYYITTPIYYVNDVPHIGHAYTTLACDVIARFKRLDGFNVFFLTGTDEHGQKVELAAKKKGVAPKEFVDEVSKNFRSLLKCMNFSNDDFIRTTEKRHLNSCEKIWKKLLENGSIYLDKYSGWYSVRDEAFYSETEIVDGTAPSGAPVEWVEEPSYFFNLSKWEDKLLKFYEENNNFILPNSRRNEVISFVKGGLKDLSVSRTSFSWGVKVPNNDDHIMYVWLDALTNYLSACNYSSPENDALSKFWPADIHMVGKDIVRFHAVYWPAFLMAADLPLPKKIFAHGWWTNEGKKISKSLGNVIDPIEIINKYGLDQFRYFLLREVPFGNDGDFSKNTLINRINSDLVNDLGNLCQRSLTMIEKKLGSIVPKIINKGNKEMALDQSIDELLVKSNEIINEFKIHIYIKHVWDHIGKVNKYFNDNKPWELEKNDKDKFLNVLAITTEQIKNIAIFIYPIMPQKSEKILNIIGIKKSQISFKEINNINIEGNKLSAVSHLFNRIKL